MVAVERSASTVCGDLWHARRMNKSRTRSANQQVSVAVGTQPRPPMEAVTAYEALMGSVRSRFLVLDVDVDGEGALNRAERFALHVRKIVEAVSFAALSATEHKNATLLVQQRTKDASQVLAWLDQKKLLRLPAATHCAIHGSAVLDGLRRESTRRPRGSRVARDVLTCKCAGS
jgi:hypothetical protein